MGGRDEDGRKEGGWAEGRRMGRRDEDGGGILKRLTLCAGLGVECWCIEELVNI
jgi:hypothetical protein